MDNNNSDKKSENELKEMSNQKLLTAWRSGSRWIKNRMRVSNSNEDGLGKPYDHQKFMLGLRRIEAIEDELKGREINYG